MHSGDEGKLDNGSLMAGGGCGAVMDDDEALEERRADWASCSEETLGGGAPLTMRSSCAWDMLVPHATAVMVMAAAVGEE